MNFILFPETCKPTVVIENTRAIRMEQVFMLKEGIHEIDFTGTQFVSIPFKSYPKIMDNTKLISASLIIHGKYIACEDQIFMNYLKIVYMPSKYKFKFEMQNKGIARLVRHFNYIPKLAMLPVLAQEAYIDYSWIPDTLCVSYEEDKQNFINGQVDSIEGTIK